MVDMRVGDEDGVDACRIEREVAVVELAHRLGALEHAAVDQEIETLRLDQIARAGNGAGGAAELDADNPSRLSPMDSGRTEGPPFPFPAIMG